MLSRVFNISVFFFFFFFNKIIKTLVSVHLHSSILCMVEHTSYSLMICLNSYRAIARFLHASFSRSPSFNSCEEAWYLSLRRGLHLSIYFISIYSQLNQHLRFYLRICGIIASLAYIKGRGKKENSSLNNEEDECY